MNAARYSLAAAVGFIIVEAGKRQRKPKSADYRDAWDSFHNGLHIGKLMCEHLTNSGKPLAG
jgi:hypothetical protein